MDEKTNSFLETESVGKLMLKYATPCVISLLVAALYNIVDQLFIANADYLGSYGNAANTVVYPLTIIPLALAVMCGDGACAYVSICLGAGKREQAHRTVGNAVLLTILFSAVVTAVYLIFSKTLLTAFGGTVNEQTWEFAKEYFFWITVGIPFYMFGQAMNPIIRSDGSPRFAMATTLAGCAVNVVLDPIFIYAFKWGMRGAAIATILGQILTAIISLYYLLHMKAVKVEPSSIKPSASIMRRFLPLGITSMLTQISIVISMAAYNNLCTKYGAMDEIFSIEEYSQIPLAVLGIVMKYFQIAISVAVGLAAGCIPVIGYNKGAGRNDRTRELLKKLLLAEAVVGLIATFIAEVFPTQIAQLFGASSESVYYTEFAVKSFRIFLCLTVLSTINKGAFIALQALGKAFLSTAVSLTREIILGVGFALLLPVFFGLDGVLYSFPAAELVTGIIVAILLIKTFKELSQPNASSPHQEENETVSEAVAG